MVLSEEVSDDGLIWTFRLRPGLKFHDGEPVLSKDVVASLARWSARDSMGLMIKAIQNELTAVDDKTFKWALKQPFPKRCWHWARTVRLRLHHAGAHRPDRTHSSRSRLHRLGPNEVREERVGARRQAVFEKFADYMPRQEKASWLAGGKQMLVDRVEWW